MITIERLFSNLLLFSLSVSAQIILMLTAIVNLIADGGYQTSPQNYMDGFAIPSSELHKRSSFFSINYHFGFSWSLITNSSPIASINAIGKHYIVILEQRDYTTKFQSTFLKTIN